MRINLGKRSCGDGCPVYFIADIGSNHDGSLERAKMLIRMAAEAGADAAKFQHFTAEGIASKTGFAAIGRPELYEVYKNAATPSEWIPELAKKCGVCGIDFLSTPYDAQAVDALYWHVNAYKIGSGDLTHLDFLRFVDFFEKPVILSTGASDIGEVQAAMDCLTVPTVLMQCGMNYSGSVGNYNHLNLNVLTTYRQMWPDAVVGLSDHTPGDTAVLGAIALGAKVIEKHFTDDNNRDGPDHKFAMTVSEWQLMTYRARLLEKALGSPRKFVTDNEREWQVIARRSQWPEGMLRPCPR